MLATACAAAIVGCGASSAPSASGSHGSATKPGAAKSSSSHTAKSAKISLHIVVTGAGAKPTDWTLTCDPPGGTHPDPAAACAVLLKARDEHKDPFGPLPVGVMCPMILANSKSAIVNGTWYGKRVSITLRDGGCDLARWSEVGQIFN
jgi:hypothetical protein